MIAKSIMLTKYSVMPELSFLVMKVSILTSKTSFMLLNIIKVGKMNSSIVMVGTYNYHTVKKSKENLGNFVRLELNYNDY